MNLNLNLFIFKNKKDLTYLTSIIFLLDSYEVYNFDEKINVDRIFSIKYSLLLSFANFKFFNLNIKLIKFFSKMVGLTFRRFF
jgi:hypothetical protein